jgi:hypothetical protein
LRNRDCSRRGRGGGRDSSRDRFCGRVRNRGKIGTDRDTDRDTRSRRRGLSRYSSSGACDGRGSAIIGETLGAAPVNTIDFVRGEPRIPPGQTRLIVALSLDRLEAVGD